MRKSIIFTFTMVLALAFASSANADFINGSFENGDFFGWATLGDPHILGAHAGGPTDGAWQAGMTTGVTGAVASIADIEMAAGIPAGSFNAFFGTNATEGSVIGQVINLNAGEQIGFDWNFSTDENFNDVNDFAFVALIGPPNLGIIFASVDSSPLGPAGGGPFNDTTGYTSFLSPALPGGSFIFVIGVLDESDTAVDSGLLVDNFEVVPLPGAWLLGAMGLGIVGWVRRRFA